MRYLSFDIEATGTGKDDYLIEFAAVPFDSHSQKLESSLIYTTFVHCPSFETLRPKLNPWVIEHNRELINKAHAEGLSLSDFKEQLSAYLHSPSITDYFKQERIVLFGKSVAALDIPFLKRDLGWDWFEKHFIHRQLDVSSVAYYLVDKGVLPKECSSGSGLMNYLGMGEVAHTALEDACNTAKMYFKLMELNR